MSIGRQMAEYEDGSKTSKYNESINQLTRLDELWRKCHRLSCQGSLIEWKWTLDAIWRELYPDAVKSDEENKTNFVNDHEKINLLISKAQVKIHLYNALNKKEEFLRLLQHRVGKGTQWIDSGEDEFD